MNRNSFSLWLATVLIAAGSIFLVKAENTPASATTGLLSATSTPQRAAWQEKLTLGPGDQINLALFQSPDTARTEVPIGPDGKISFLQARDIMAAGLTIDELRAELDKALDKYYQNPRTIVTPAAFHSKKYFVLGAVVNKGVYTMDRPLTVIEALARAGGLETGVYDQKTVELADLPRSFLVRNKQRVPVDFDRLFQQGDLSQNVPVEPGDYLYVASADNNQIYVLGEVTLPGIVVFSPNATVVSAIAARGGFSNKAYKGKVLVVRGSLGHPQAFAVNPAGILAGREKDFKLQPKDIVYVSASPWAKVEDLIDTAARAFLQGMFVEWTTLRVGPMITEPLIK